MARRFHGICISTAEHSIAEYAAMAGEVRDGGELFRAIDVDAIRKGKATIFDLAPQDLDQRATLQDLRKATAECHGTALTPYIQYLMRMGRIVVKNRALALIKEFVDHMPQAAHDGVICQMATHFGLLYAGGILAIESGVLPWTRDHLQTALRRGFNDAVAGSRPVDLLATGLDILRAKLSVEIVVRNPDSTFGVNDHAGYWRRIGGEKTYVVHARQFREWFATVGQCNLVRRSLAAKSVSHRWPDQSLVRCVEFSDPFPEANPTPGRPGLRMLKTGRRYTRLVRR